LRPEHSETKAKTETRECETETSPVKPIACESNTNRYVLFFILHTWGEWWTGTGFCI